MPTPKGPSYLASWIPSTIPSTPYNPSRSNGTPVLPKSLVLDHRLASLNFALNGAIWGRRKSIARPSQEQDRLEQSLNLINLLLERGRIYPNQLQVRNQGYERIAIQSALYKWGTRRRGNKSVIAWHFFIQSVKSRNSIGVCVIDTIW